jgi:hypothetical protein
VPNAREEGPDSLRKHLNNSTKAVEETVDGTMSL